MLVCTIQCRLPAFRARFSRSKYGAVLESKPTCDNAASKTTNLVEVSVASGPIPLALRAGSMTGLSKVCGCCQRELQRHLAWTAQLIDVDGPVLPFAGIGLAALQLPQSGRW